MVHILVSERAEHLDWPSWLVSECQSKAAGCGLGKGCPHSCQPVWASFRTPWGSTLQRGLFLGPREETGRWQPWNGWRSLGGISECHGHMHHSCSSSCVHGEHSSVTHSVLKSWTDIQTVIPAYKPTSASCAVLAASCCASWTRVPPRMYWGFRRSSPYCPWKLLAFSLWVWHLPGHWLAPSWVDPFVFSVAAKYGAWPWWFLVVNSALGLMSFFCPLLVSSPDRVEEVCGLPW